MSRAVLMYVHPGTVTAEFMDSVDAMQRHDITNPPGVLASRLAVRSGVNICEARNDLVAKFLEQNDGDWAWFCDVDMEFDAVAVEALLWAAQDVGVKVIGALCCTVHDDGLRTTVFADDDDTITKAALSFSLGVIEVAATGTGFLLVHRDVLVAMQDAAGGSRWCWFTEVERVSASGQHRWVGEDVTFCLEARRLGFPVCVDCGVHVGHVKAGRTWWPSDLA